MADWVVLDFGSVWPAVSRLIPTADAAAKRRTGSEETAAIHWPGQFLVFVHEGSPLDNKLKRRLTAVPARKNTSNKLIDVARVVEP